MKKIEELEKKLSEIQNELAELKKQPQSRYPKSKWVELWQYNNNALLISGLPFNNKYLLFAALVETCKEWNRIDNFMPDWSSNNVKWCVYNKKDELIIGCWNYYNHPICLKDKETAHLFLDTYRDEIEQVKDLI